MIKLPYYQFSVMIGILLADAKLQISGKNLIILQVQREMHY